MVPVPTVGRIVSVQRPVRLGDASPGGRLRFDALARMLQDVANDDANAAVADSMSWVVRRVAIEVHQSGVFNEMLTLTTFCGGLGSRWAQRRTSISGDRGARIEAAALWVHLDMDTMRPKVLGSDFVQMYGEAAGGRTVRARLLHDDPPSTLVGEPYWPRFVDFDVLGHMNNAAYWNAIEQELSERPALRHPLRAEIEYRQGIEPHHSAHLVHVAIDPTTGAAGIERTLSRNTLPTPVSRQSSPADISVDAPGGESGGGDGFALWFVDGTTVFASARVWRTS